MRQFNIKITNLELEVIEDANGDIYKDIQELKDEIKRIYSLHESIYYQHQNLTRIVEDIRDSLEESKSLNREIAEELADLLNSDKYPLNNGSKIRRRISQILAKLVP